MKIRDKRGITHNLMLAGLAVLVLSTVGFAGFRVYKTRNDTDAKAYNWLIINASGGATLKTCTSKVSATRWLVRWSWTGTSTNRLGVANGLSGQYTKSEYLYNNPGYVSYQPYTYQNKIPNC